MERAVYALDPVLHVGTGPLEMDLEIEKAVAVHVARRENVERPGAAVIQQETLRIELRGIEVVFSQKNHVG
jgi:hypothetical protein